MAIRADEVHPVIAIIRAPEWVKQGDISWEGFRKMLGEIAERDPSFRILNEERRYDER